MTTAAACRHQDAPKDMCVLQLIDFWGPYRHTNAYAG